MSQAGTFNQSGGGGTTVTSVTGTANQITASPTTGAVILSIPATFIAPGSIASTTSLTAGNGFTVTTGTITLTPLSTSGIVVNSSAGVISTTATTNHAVQVGNASGQLTSIAVGATGTVLTGSTGADPSFTALSGITVTSITGTANQITASASTGAVTLSIPSTFIAPGSIASTTSLTAGNGFTVTTGTITLTPLSTSGVVINSSAGVITTLATTNHNVQVGNASGQLSSVAPSPTSGVPLVSQGAAADPAFGTAVVAGGGTGLTATTVGGLLLGTSTTAFTNLTIGANNTVLVSNGTTASWDSVPATAGVTSIAGTANQITASAATGAVTLSIPSTFIAPGSIASTTSLTAGNAFTVTTGTITLTPLSTSGVVLNSAAGVLSTGATTNHAVQVGNASGQLTSIAVGATGTVLTGSTAADPSFAALSGIAVTSITGTANQITASASVGAVTLSTPATFIAPGSIASTTSITAGNLTTAGIVYNAVTTGLLSSHQTTQYNVQIGNSTGQLADVAPSATSGVPLISQGAAANPVFGTAVVAGGGTGLTATTVGGLLLGTSTTAFTNLTIGANNTVLVSNGTTASWAAVPATAGVTSIAGTANQITASAATGAVTLSTPAVFIAPGSIASTTTNAAGTNFLLPTTSSTAGQILLNGTRWIHGYGTNQIFIGNNAGNFTLTTGSAIDNVCIGTSSGVALTTGADNVFVGHQAGLAATTLSSSVIIGSQAGAALTDSQNNILIGGLAGNALTTTCTRNVIIGHGSVQTATSGNERNVVVGEGNCTNWTTNSTSNIVIGWNIDSVASEANTLRIGAGTGTSNGKLNKAIISGIDGTNVGSVSKVVTMASDQLGTATLTAGTGVTITPAANTITIASTGGGFTWASTTVNASMVAGNGYIANKAGLLTMTLPTTAAVGDMFAITNINTAVGWRIAQNASQQIRFGTSTTTSGTGGYLEALALGDTITLVCTAANNSYQVISWVGALITVI